MVLFRIYFNLVKILIQIIFVADSHRPIDVCNIYNDGQIRLLMKADENDGKPLRLSSMIINSDYKTV